MDDCFLRRTISDFEIQRLIGAGGWQTVSFVNTQALNGMSSADLNYSFTDQNPTKV